jgi:sec-independent protein translocase protein TatA
MPSIGPLELVMVAVIGLIVFGPHRLPEIARSVGKAIAEFKRQASDIRSEFESGMEDEPEDEKVTPELPPDATPPSS